MSDDEELIITWDANTSRSYDVNLDSMYISNGGTFTSGGTSSYDINMSTISNGGTFTSGNVVSPTWITNTTIGAAGSNYQFSDWSIGQNNVTQSGQLNLTGDNADIVINGQSLNATLTAIQERMGMLVPNTEMEAEWDELRELAERYRELEKLCKEKSTVWNKLKKI
jgi:hypothetical protein